MINIYVRRYFYGQPPTWLPLTDGGLLIKAPSTEAAKALIAALRAGVHRLRHGEYSAPDYGIRGEDGRIRPIEL